ncbi:MAG TPA: prolyl oligopeptidase family serine peptidase [Mycobacteriales bacterium]|nr:prolyl oligopeptidase family serine peptidase [Mycobacteriales bacterium]
MSISFPRQHARTRRFTLGVPRAFTVSPDGQRVFFLRTKSGVDPVTCLWRYDVPTGAETLLADPAALGADEQDLPPEERARRERTRESAGGIVGYATDNACTAAVFALAGQAYRTELATGETRELPTATPVIDPRLDPTGSRVAYVAGRALRVLDLDTGSDRALAEPENELVCYGLAEFAAAEEMGRFRGYWWSPDGTTLLVERSDESPVNRWHIADPANPGTSATEVRYPAAGTPNADVELILLTVDGARTPVDLGDFPYITEVSWSSDLLVTTQSRDQRTVKLSTVDPETAAVTTVRTDSDPIWLDIVPGVPARTGSGHLVWTADQEDARRLLIDGEPVTPPSLQVRGVNSLDGDTVLFTASEEPTEIDLWSYGPGGLERIAAGGVHSGQTSGGTTVVIGHRLDADGVSVRILQQGKEIGTIASLAERPAIAAPRVELIRAGERELRTAVLLPTGHQPGSGPLPVLLDPYGGPHAQRVTAARAGYLTSQWFADQGFAVVITDGRGTPGRGPAWDRAVHGDLATAVLEDQIEGLTAAAERYPDLDLARVGIRGWSFGGYLAALAVLRRPDVFHAAIAGAPVTDWRLYDTHYTERYLGDPTADPAPYDRSSLLDDAEKLTRPLLLIHGLADDNVVAAHTLRLSSALLAAGRPHSVLPLSGVTHMTPQEVVAENLLLLQVDFLVRSLGGVTPAGLAV